MIYTFSIMGWTTYYRHRIYPSENFVLAPVEPKAELHVAEAHSLTSIELTNLGNPINPIF